MRNLRWMFPLAMAAGAFSALAADIDIRVILPGDIRPGLYGRVDLGGAPPPPVLYAQPVIISRSPPRPVPVQPLYLHVPPGHAKNWSKHCRKYNACGVPVYFVRSEEYEPKKGKKPKKDKG